AAATTGTQALYPVKSRRLVRGRRDNAWLELRWKDDVFLVQRPPQGVWAGLWSLPELESTEALDAAAAGWPGAGEALPAFVHTLTHFDWHLRPVRWTLPARTAVRSVARVTAAWPSGRWFGVGEALALGLPAPLRKRLASPSPRLAGRGSG
ncbi:MAG TPA: NUDIX domain-containing protein, partial [Planctomycetota bacterium]|nr:NUDIX domain-containing protein [Planctomycetota bacterium]